MAGVFADVVVVGGGAIGLTSAWFLARSGFKVVLLDQDQLGKAASWAGAGIVPPGCPDLAQSPMDKLRAWGSRLHPQLHQELLDLTGIDNGYRVCGGLELLAHGDEPDSRRVAGWRQENLEFRFLDGPSIGGMIAGVAGDVLRGIHFPEMAQIRNPRHIRALIQACVQHHVGLMSRSPIAQFDTKDDRVVSLVTEDGRVIHFGSILFAMGAWTSTLCAKPFYFPVEIEPIRGQMIQVLIPESIAWPILEQGKQYLVPRGDGLVLVGSTEEAVGFDATTSEEGIQSLRDFLGQLLPDWKDLEPIRSWAGLRPFAVRGIPFIGPMPGFQNAFINAGHFRWGLQFSPRAAQMAVDLIQGDGPSLADSRAFRVDAPADPGGPKLFSS